jgi:L-malate glycosyltransferase
MRIVLAIWSLRMGGAEMFSKQLAKEFIKRGHDIYLFPLLEPPDPSLVSDLNKENIPLLVPFKSNLLSWMIWKLNAISLVLFSFHLRGHLTQRYILREIRKKKIQLVISNSSLTDEFMANHLSGIPFISIEHGQYCMALIEHERINRAALAKAVQVISVSNWCATQLRDKLQLNSTVIYNGYLNSDEAEATPDPDGRRIFTFTMIARGVAQKGWEIAIKAFLKVIEKKEAQLVLVGAGEYLSMLEKSYIHPAILFKGQMNSIDHVIQNTDIGLFPSQKYEAFGLSILDFFSKGKPVLASNLGGIPEVMDDGLGAGGLLIQLNQQQQPDVDHLAQLMTEVMENKSLRDELSRNAKRIKAHFDFQKTVTQYEQVCLGSIEK